MPLSVSLSLLASALVAIFVRQVHCDIEGEEGSVKDASEGAVIIVCVSFDVLHGKRKERVDVAQRFSSIGR